MLGFPHYYILFLKNFCGIDTFISSRQRGNMGEKGGGDMQQRTSSRNQTRVGCVLWHGVLTTQPPARRLLHPLSHNSHFVHIFPSFAKCCLNLFLFFFIQSLSEHCSVHRESCWALWTSVEVKERNCDCDVKLSRLRFWSFAVLFC